LVMVQAEVADRLAAPPGSKVYGVPSAKLAWYGRAWRAGNISRNVFWPVPNVDSALVAFERTGSPRSATVLAGPPGLPNEVTMPGTAAFDANAQENSLLAKSQRRQVFAVVDAAFAQRRKTLRSALAGLFGGAQAAEIALRACGIDPGARGETLDITQFAALAAHLPPAGK